MTGVLVGNSKCDKRMTEAQAARKLATLPPMSRQVLLDLIDVLRSTPIAPASALKKNRRPLKKEKFIGLWRGRQEMSNSAAWVASQRRREWSR
jgi:hypothetical protein